MPKRQGKASRRGGRVKGSKNRPKPLPLPVPQSPEDARASAAATLNRLLKAVQDPVEARRLSAQIIKLTVTPRGTRTGTGTGTLAYEDTEAAKDARVRRVEAQTARTIEKQAAGAVKYGWGAVPERPPAVPTPAEQQARTDKPDNVDPMDTVDAGRHKADAAQADKADKQTAAIVAATLNPPVPARSDRREPVINEALEKAVRERMYREASVNRGSCDYNTPMYSVKDLYEKESDIPEYVAPETFHERYSFNGF
jgi:hypothetical protein